MRADVNRALSVGRADWTREDYVRDLTARGYTETQAATFATMYLWRAGKLDLAPAPVRVGWTGDGYVTPWFHHATSAEPAKIGFVEREPGRGFNGPHQLVLQDGTLVGPGQRHLAGMLAWLQANGWWRG
jgi:hypothetical protein